MDDFVRFICPKCHKRCKAQSAYGGRVAVCKCGQRLRVPATQTLPPSDIDEDSADHDSDQWDESFDFLDDHSDHERPQSSPKARHELPRKKSPPNGWLIAWAILSIVVIVVGVSQRHWAILYQGPFGSAIVIGLSAAVHYGQTPCPSCQRRWAGTAWDHPRKDGGPDRRFSNNCLRCCGCGHAHRGA